MDRNATPSVEEEPFGFRDVEISREPIELYKILKFENMVESGSEAKAAGHALLRNGSSLRKGQAYFVMCKSAITFEKRNQYITK